MTLEDEVHGLGLHALRRAQELGSVNATCRELGIPRAVFYLGTRTPPPSAQHPQKALFSYRSPLPCPKPY